MRGIQHIALICALLGPAAADAQQEGPAAGAPQLAPESVEEFMERYETALDHGDPTLLRDVYEDWTVTKARKLDEYFSEIVTEFNVEFSELEIDWLEPDLARVRFLRRDDFTDVFTGERVRRHKRLVKLLRRHAGRWKVLPPE